MAKNYDNIPEVLRWDKSWLLAGPAEDGKNKAPHSFNNQGQTFRASPVDPKHWFDFETAVEAVQHYKSYGIGFVLTRTDGFTCIDLDIKNSYNEPDSSKHTSEENIARFHRIIETFDSYTERSASGQGFHIWVQGKVGSGLKRDGVELYSQERFIVCTGDVYKAKPIEKRQELLDILVVEISNGTEDGKTTLVDIEPTEDDKTLFRRAADADNGEKFKSLCEGEFSNYPSQSEADLALMSILAFYSKSNEQCRRMFRQTKLGQRPKATKNNVALDRLLMVIRARQEVDNVIDIQAAAHAAALVAQLNKSTVIAPPAAALPQAVVGLIAPPAPVPPIAPNSLKPAKIPLPEELLDVYQPPIDTIGYEERNEIQSNLEWPPGFVGEVARFMFESAPRPVREVSIVAALGLMAGLCGKNFHIPQSGLNLYIVLVARSAIGKEAMHSGISNVMALLRESFPNSMNYVDFSDYASGPALSKAIAANPSFVNLSGEWGRKLKRLAQEDAKDGPMQQLRTVMTNLYQKSGPQSIVGGIGYSDKDKNVASVSGAAYSMIGETTPNTFYDSLTENMMEDGFLSRFTVIEYTGQRPPANHKGIQRPNEMFLTTLTGLVAHTLQISDDYDSVLVHRSPAAAQVLDEFDKECDVEINKTADESWRQMWNRAHLKAYRIAALLAVGDNHVIPTIELSHITWAIALVRKDIDIMRRRISTGDVGTGDAARERKIIDILKKYLSAPVPAGYGIDDRMRSNGVVPHKYLQLCTQRSNSFTGHRLGQNGILAQTIKTMIDSGYLVEMERGQAVRTYDFHGRCYRVVHLPLDSKEQKIMKYNKLTETQ